jgi:hypothetical protein
MKKHYLALLAFTFPIAAMAQVTNAENYSVGDEIHYMTCSLPSGGPGASGTGQTWNFASVSDSGVSTIWVFDDTSSTNAGDIILSQVSQGPAGTPVHKTASQNLTTSVNAVIGTLDYTPGLLLAERSFNYNTTDNVAFTVSGLGTGSGNVDFNCDGTGSLTTPAGNYPSAYRVKMVHDEVDTIIILTTSTATRHDVSYIWYDASHTAPLFRIDSTEVAGTGTLAALTDTSATAQYLQAVFPTAINGVAKAAANESANLSGSELMVSANLKNGQPYEVALFNISGQEVYKNAFTATGTIEHFNTNTQLAAGTYFVNIYQKGSHNAPVIIKTIKN